MRLRTKEINMLEGPLLPKIVSYAIPLACASILQQLFNSADLAIIGRFENSIAMAAVGANSSLISLLISLFSGLSLGSNVTIASFIGMDRKKDVNQAIHTTIALSLISGLILCIAGEIIAPMILSLMSTPDSVLKLAVVYLRILFLALPFLLIYDFGASILRAKGDSTRPLYVLFLSGIINIVLNLIFVGPLHMSVAGVALGTLFANMFSAAMVIAFLLYEDDPYRLHLDQLKIEKKYLTKIISIGAPAGIQGMVFSFSNVIIQSGINSFGPDAIAGNTAALNFETMGYYVVNAFGQAATTFTSQNYSANLVTRCKKIYRITMSVGMCATLLFSTIFWFARYPLMSLFTSSPAVMHYGFIRLFYIDNLELLTGSYEISGGCLRGMRHSLEPAIITMIGSCLFRIIWVSTIFRTHHTLSVLMIVYPISWIICGVCVHIAYFKIRTRLFREINM